MSRHDHSCIRGRGAGHEDISIHTNSTADEGEHEGRIARHLGRDLEFEKPDAGAEDYDVDADDDRLAVVSHHCVS